MGQSAMGICELCYMYVMYLVYWFSRDLFLIGGGGGVNRPWVYVHCAISAKCDVALFKASMLDWRRGVGSICHGHMCILLDMKLI